MAIRFVDQLPEGSGWYCYQEFVDQAKANPGRWGELVREDNGGNYLYSLASHIRTGHHTPRAFAGAKWEAKIVNRRLWIKYLGEADESA